MPAILYKKFFEAEVFRRGVLASKLVFINGINLYGCYSGRILYKINHFFCGLQTTIKEKSLYL